MNVNIMVQGRGRPLVLFHGWGFDSHVWHSLLPVLTSRYQLHQVDLPGFGLTPPMEWEEFKAALLEQLPTSMAIAGWSMGGLFATRLVIEEPQRFTHLINIATSPCFIREKNWPGIDRQILKAFHHDLVSVPKRTLKQFIQLQLQGQILPEMVGEQIPTLVGLQAGLDVLAHWDLRQDLTKLDKPVCYMFGQLDAIVPRITMKTMQTTYPHFNYVMFPKAAHVPFLSHPEQFITVLEGFLR